MSKPFHCHQAQLEVISSIQNSTQIVNWFQGLPMCEFISLRTRLEAQTAIIESFTNAVQHAHKDLPPSTPIKIDVEVKDSNFKMMMWDQGPPYNFSQAMQDLVEAKNPSVIDPLHREKHWGQVLFLKLSQDFGWTFSYDRRTEHENVFVMKKKLQMNA